MGNLRSRLGVFGFEQHHRLRETRGRRQSGIVFYGSGCSSEFSAASIDRNSTSALAEMRIGDHLSNRRELTFEEYTELLEENLRCLVPQKSKDVDIERYSKILAWAKDRRKMLGAEGD